LVLPSTRYLKKIPSSVIEWEEARWILLPEGPFWVAFPREMKSREACESLRIATGATWLRRCSKCIALEVFADAGKSGGGGTIFGRYKSALETVSQAESSERDHDFATSLLDLAILKCIRHFEERLDLDVDRGQALQDFFSLINDDEESRSLGLNFEKASREQVEEAMAGRRRGGAGKRGRPQDRPALNSLIRSVADVFRSAKGDSARVNLWVRVSKVIRPFLYLDDKHASQRMTPEAVRQHVKRHLRKQQHPEF
jgi:hypothetical protein